jgi:predicted transcriptional regulator
MSKKLVQQELGVEEGGHLDIVVTEVVDINRFWINVRSTDILGAMYVENGSVVAAPYYQEG